MQRHPPCWGALSVTHSDIPRKPVASGPIPLTRLPRLIQLTRAWMNLCPLGIPNRCNLMSHNLATQVQCLCSVHARKEIHPKNPPKKPGPYRNPTQKNRILMHTGRKLRRSQTHEPKEVWHLQSGWTLIAWGGGVTCGWHNHWIFGGLISHLWNIMLPEKNADNANYM